MKPEKETRKVGTKRTTKTSKKEEETSVGLKAKGKAKASTTKTKSARSKSSEEIASGDETKQSSGVKSSKSAAAELQLVTNSVEAKKKTRIPKKKDTISDGTEEHLRKSGRTSREEKQFTVQKATKRKAADADEESKVTRKKKVLKKTTGIYPETEEQGKVDETVEESSDVDRSKKKVRKPIKTQETLDVKMEPDGRDIKPKRKRKVVDKEVATKPERKQKLSTTSTEPKTRTKKSTKEQTTKKAVAKEGVVEEESVVKEEVNGESEDETIPEMAKEAVSKAAKFVGAHMSISGGLDKSVKGAVATGSKAFALFLRSQRQWAAKPLEDKPAEKFRQACREHGFPPHLILPHGSYLMNCGSPNDETLRKSREALVDELKRCEKLGLTRYNFHPGSSCGQITMEECLDKISESINKVHQQTNKVMTVIENMSCQGSTVGGRFEELSGIIERVTDKSRIGVCLDTCHAFAAGFDISTEAGYEKMMSDFDQIIGLEYLVAVHLNDSKGKVGSHLDRHEKIGQGHIGLETFKRLMNDPRFDNIPLILETPVEDGMEYTKEIKLLNSLVRKS